MSDTTEPTPAPDLDALAALEAAATEGPWEAGVERVWSKQANPSDETVGHLDRPADRDLIVALRNAAPALIAAARENEAREREVRRIERQHNAMSRAHATAVAERDAAQAALARVEALHAESWECGNLSHTNPAVGCPECDVFCRLCGDSYPCATIRAVAGEEQGS